MIRATGMKSFTALAPLRQGHPADGPHGIADGAGGAVAIADAAAGKSDLAQHRGENRRHPVRLFTMVGALQATSSP